MPSSVPCFISDVLTKIPLREVKSVLDIGVGFGKWGHLFREYLDVYQGRVFDDDWQATIDGVEIFKPYLDQCHHLKYVYDRLWNSDVRDHVEMMKGKYDVIIAGDVIEHLPVDDAIEVLQKLRANCRFLIVSLPLGKEWLNNSIVAGNEAEKHRSAWSVSSLIEALNNERPEYVRIEKVPRDIGLFIFGK